MNIDQSAPIITRDEIVIATTLNRVWELFTDVSAWADWQKDIENSSPQSPLAVGAVIIWTTGGLTIASTVGELIPQRRIAWSGTAHEITGIHVWTFTPVEDGVIVHTEESWDGDPVRQRRTVMQQALDRFIRSWLESLKRAAEKQD